MHENGFHIFQINIKGSRIYGCDDLRHEPALRHIHLAQIIQSPHTVIFYNNLGRFVFLLALCQKHFVKFGFVLQHYQSGIAFLKHLILVLFYSFLAGNDQIALAIRKIFV